MITKEMIEDATQVYLHSYTVALNETHNPNLAVQCATSVTMVLANIIRQKPQNDPMGMLFTAIMSGMAQQSKGMKKPQPKRKDPEKDSGGEENTK
ncbi:MAG: hypothetical protein NC543_08355 [bacterium]|nr:hypothetical protein [bacterium]MCM1373592.1 hypothetical protein [Muribaculum sp.]